MVIVSNGVKESEYKKISFSNVMVTRKRSLFWGRKWKTSDIMMCITFISIHLLALFAPFMFTRNALFVGYGRALLCMLFGITLSYHRNLTHHSFKLPKWLEYTFAYIGVLAFQGDPIFWVSTHRYHHKYVDTEKDPHSPIFGFWFSHMGWMLEKDFTIEKYEEGKNVEDLKSQKFYRFLHRTYLFHLLSFVVLVYAIGGFTYLVWVVGVSTLYIHHGTFLVNSACHIWGNQIWDTGDLSKNNWWMGLIAFGEGWHNNHHAFEYSARHGLYWWQIDFCWYTIQFLERVGLATNVKLPTEAHKLKKSFAASGIDVKLVVKDVIREIAKWWRIPTPGNTMTSLLFWGETNNFSDIRLHLFKALILTFLWYMWKARNKWIHNNKKDLIPKLFNSILHKSLFFLDRC